MPEQLKPTVQDSSASVQSAERGIVSKTLHESRASTKIILMCLEPGQALSEHAAPFEAIVQVLQGTADFKLGRSSH